MKFHWICPAATRLLFLTSTACCGLLQPFLVRAESPPTAQWLARGGGGIPDSANAVAVDASGNVYFAGTFGSNAVFGATALSAVDGYDLYLAKLDASGNFLWAKTVETGCGNLYPCRLLVDGAGKLVLMATPAGDAGPNPPLNQLLLGRYEPANGAAIWTRKVKSGLFASVIGNALTLDAANNLYVAGTFSGTADFGNGVTLTSSGLGDVFVAKLNANGTAQIARRFGQAGSPDDEGFGVVVDSSSNVWVAAHFAGTITVGTNVLVSAGNTDIVVTKYDPAFNVIWAKQFGSTGEDLARGLARDANGNVFMFASVTGPYALGIAYPFDGHFVARLDANGGLVWATPLTLGPTLTGSHGFVADSTGNLLVSGKRFLGKVNSQGTVVWQRIVENGDYYDAAVISVTNIFLAGEFDGTLNLDSLTATNAGFGDAVIAKLVLPPIVAPQISLQPSNQTVNAGATVNFLVTATGTAPLAYQWRFNGTNINGATTTNLALNNVQTNAAGGYSALVANSAGAVTSQVATLTVNIVLPSISQQPTNVTVVAGANAAFYVTATGTLPLTYQWRFNNTNLPAATNATLNLVAVATNQAGPYRVVVSNPGGSVTSVVATLTVNLIAPTITKQPVGTNVFAGTNVSFTVTATGSLPLSYFWRRNGTNLGAPNVSTLTLNNVQPADSGPYSVVVSNAAGSITSSIAVLVVQTLLPSGPPFDWVRGGGGTFADEGRAVAVDPAGNIYFAGKTIGSWRFGSTVIPTSDQGPFLVKLDPNGNALWVRRGSGAGATDVATEGPNVFLLGGPGAVTLGGITNSNSGGWIAKCDPNGNFAWIKPFGGNGGTALAPDGAGGAYLAGTFFGTASIGGIVVTNSNTFDFFWARVNSSGTFVWARSGRRIGGNTSPGITSLRVDAEGRLWAAGSFSGGINLGGVPLTNVFTYVGGYNVVQAFVARFQPDGSLIGQTVTTNAAAIQVVRLSLSGPTNAVVAGYFPAGAVTWGSQTITNASFWVGRIDGNGTMREAAGALVDSYVYDVAVVADSRGNTYVGLTGKGNTNHLFGTAAVPGGPELSRALFAKWNSSGAWEWGRTDGAGQTNYPAWLRNLAVDRADRLLLVGDWSGTNRTFGTFFMTNSAPPSQELWIARLPAPALPQLRIVASGATGNLLVSWPLGAADWVLDSTTALETAFSNFNYTATTNVTAGTVEVLLPATNVARFFILRRP